VQPQGKVLFWDDKRWKQSDKPVKPQRSKYRPVKFALEYIQKPSVRKGGAEKLFG
jgi:hypothetical protein